MEEEADLGQILEQPRPDAQPNEEQPAPAASGPGKRAEEAAAKARAGTRQEVAALRSEVEYLRRQVHGLRSKLHGELAVLAVRIEDNDRRGGRRRQLIRQCAIAALAFAWLCVVAGAAPGLFGGAFLGPGLLVAGATLVGGIAIAVMLLQNRAEQEDHADRYHNWFRLTVAEPHEPHRGPARQNLAGEPGETARENLDIPPR